MADLGPEAVHQLSAAAGSIAAVLLPTPFRSFNLVRRQPETSRSNGTGISA